MKHGIHRPNSCCVLCYDRAQQDDDVAVPPRFLTRPQYASKALKGAVNSMTARRDERGGFVRTW